MPSARRHIKAIDEKIRAIKEKIEGRNSCEYCNPDKPKVFMSAKTPHGRIQSFIESGGILDMDYPGGIRAKRINYCPICGRKFM